MPKRSLRQECLRRRADLDPAAFAAAAATIQQRFLALPEYAAARVVALYQAVRGEVPVDHVLAQALRDGKTVAMPRVTAVGLEFIAVADPRTLRPGAFGIPEPQSGTVLAPAALELMAVPGVAFDRQGHRLGYGKGYYDRYLFDAGSRCRLVGVAFACQVVDRLPAEGHDIRMHRLVTETATLRFDQTPSSDGAYFTDEGGSSS